MNHPVHVFFARAQDAAGEMGVIGGIGVIFGFEAEA